MLDGQTQDYGAHEKSEIVATREAVLGLLRLVAKDVVRRLAQDADKTRDAPRPVSEERPASSS